MGLYYSSALLTVLATAALIPLATLPVLARTVRKYGRLHGWPLFAAAGLIASAAALAAFTVFPLPSEDDLLCSAAGLENWQTTPLHSIDDLRAAADAVGTSGLAGTFTFWQLAANVALFVPFAFFLHQAARWPGLAVVALSFAVSCTIELSQGTGFFGVYPCPYRRFDIDDIITNTTGAILGVVLSAIVGALFRFTRPAPTPDLAPPGRVRRALAVLIDLTLALLLVAGLQVVLVLAWEVTTGGDAERIPENSALSWGTRVAVAVWMGVIVPGLRRDRATWGQAVMYITPARVDAPGAVQAGWSLWVRAVVRWVPWVLSPAVAGPLMVMAEFACTVVRRDRRSVSDVASGTRMSSVPAMEQARRYGVAQDPGSLAS